VNHLYWLSQIQHSEQPLVGEQLFILSQLVQQGYPILPGFVLGNSLLLDFLASLDHSKSLIGNLPDSSWHLDVDNYRVLQSIAQRSRQTINETVFAQEWQERIFKAAQLLNSSTLILHPFLAIPNQQHLGSRGLWRSQTCFSTPEALTSAVKRVWGELFTASSLLYWQKLGLNIEKVGIAVSIRPLKTAVASGIIEVGSDTVRIQAIWGLGQSLWQGDVQPDVYYLDRYTGDILGQQLGHKNYAYKSKDFDPTSLEDCLEIYIPSETESETYVLNHSEIAILIQSTQAILAKQPRVRYLVWTLPQVGNQVSTTPQFYFTHLSYHLSSSVDFAATISQLSLSSSIPPLLVGLAASPGNVLATVVVIDNLDREGCTLPDGCILVTKSIAPHQISLLKHIGGIVTEEGGITSHGAMMARELRIPAIVNAAHATKTLQNGMVVLLKGDQGKVYPEAASRKLSLSLSSHNHGVLTPNYPIATKLMVNLSQPEAIAHSVKLPVDGVGLLRSELMLADLLASQPLATWKLPEGYAWRSQFVDTLTNSLCQFISAFAPRPVFYRSIDWYAQNTEVNSLVDNRGTYNYLSNPDLFDLELEALATIAAEGYSNLNLILPFVRSVEEFKFCRRRIENIGLTTRSSFQLWIMAEVPSVIFLLPEYIRAGVQGIAIGTNDLTQLLLGVDREQAHFSDRGLDANHPAMHSAIASLIQTAKANGIPCSVCGQAPVQHPSLIEKLVEWGVTSISVEPDAVEKTYQAISRAEKRLLLNSIIQ
jgi:pyruvate, water dikinase